MRHQEHASADGVDILRAGGGRVRFHRHDGGALRGQRLFLLQDVDRWHRVYQRGVRLIPFSV